LYFVQVVHGRWQLGSTAQNINCDRVPNNNKYISDKHAAIKGTGKPETMQLRCSALIAVAIMTHATLQS
jgi:uncharacterized protein YijF (DUF1287 family)